MSTELSKTTVVVDLDATLANYEGWDIHGEFPGDPREDVVDGLRRLKAAGWSVGIYSTRNTTVIQQWVQKHNLSNLIDFINDNPNQPDGCAHKPIAHTYIDDRSARYNGNNMNELVDAILNGQMEPWYKS